MDEFRKRLNKKALDQDEAKPATGGDSTEWSEIFAPSHRGPVPEAGR